MIYPFNQPLHFQLVVWQCFLVPNQNFIDEIYSKRTNIFYLHSGIPESFFHLLFLFLSSDRILNRYRYWFNIRSLKKNNDCVQ